MFRRASEIYTEPTLFSDDVAIRQGGIGNCYLLAVVQAMAERGQFDVIKDVFLTKEINKAGIYLLVFYVNGVKTPVVVDDFFPTRGEGLIYA